MGRPKQSIRGMLMLLALGPSSWHSPPATLSVLPETLLAGLVRPIRRRTGGAVSVDRDADQEVGGHRHACSEERLGHPEVSIHPAVVGAADRPHSPKAYLRLCEGRRPCRQREDQHQRRAGGHHQWAAGELSRASGERPESSPHTCCYSSEQRAAARRARRGALRCAAWRLLYY
jgi:hypothetical protein